MVRILAIPGSLRNDSSSNMILQALGRMAPPNVSFEIFGGVGQLPHFDGAEEPRVALDTFREKIKSANAVLICTPEYAFGIPGSLKNALDWTVGSGEFVNKPVGIITASSQGEKGHAALLLVMTAISARIVGEATLLISSVRSKVDATGRINDPAVARDVQKALNSLILAAASL